MGGINCRRVFLGGLVAGLAALFAEVMVELVLLAGVLGVGTERQRLASVGYSREGWLAWNHLINLAFPFLIGILLVAAYAAVRPRFGPGLKAALVTSGIFLTYWLLILVYLTNHQIFTLGQSGASLLDNLIVVPAATIAGAAVYRE